jgi:hypothetical protein
MRKDDVLAALNKLGVTARCEVCGENSWGGIGPEGEERLVHIQAIDLDRQITPGQGIECAPLICNRCGNVRLHATQVLQQA